MAEDIFHSAVVNALTKEDWKITKEQQLLRIGTVDMYLDIAAERLIVAERAHEKIAVEVKSFMGRSNISEFHTAIGQFMNYHAALAKIEPERTLYLAIPFDTYRDFFQKEFIRGMVEKLQIKLIVYHPVKEVIVEWKR